MKRHSVLSPMISIIIVSTLPGCKRLIDWGYDTFYQGNSLHEDLCLVPYYLRSVRVYKELMTRAIFDVMWLSDDIRRLYVKLHVMRMGLSDDFYKTMLRRKLEDNNHYITFYVLSLYDVPLDAKISKWSLFLRIGNKDYQPVEIKKVELQPEYCTLFSSRCNRFKTPYEVKFHARDQRTDELIINPEANHMHLYFRSITHEAQVVWNIDEHGASMTTQSKQHKQDCCI